MQVREKTPDTGEVRSSTYAFHAHATDRPRRSWRGRARQRGFAYNVPVITDDRVDVALAMGADGVHSRQGIGAMLEVLDGIDGTDVKAIAIGAPRHARRRMCC